MADQRLLPLIRKGISGWEQWRSKNPHIVPDLSWADLKGIELRGVDLSYANLAHADLSKADLTGSILTHADLSEAKLHEVKLCGNPGDRFEDDFLRSSPFWEKLGMRSTFNGEDRRRDSEAADLHGAILRKADLRSADLSSADLRVADLREADLRDTNLRRTNFVGAYLREADLSGADLRWADLDDTNLRQANLNEANLRGAYLRKANLRGAYLRRADLSRADLTEASLSGADLREATLVATNLELADLTDAKIYGVSVWDVKVQSATQINLVVTNEQPDITVDNLEVAQFIYLLLNNSRIRNVINTITSKVVLILGRFTPERKPTLDALRDALRTHNYLPILFDFEKPTNRDFTETVSTLAHLARFVIADLTDPRSIPQELTAIIPRLLSVPVRPLLLGSQSEWGMFSDLQRYPQVIPPLHYTNDVMLLSCIVSDVIAPAEQRALELSTKGLSL